MVVLVALDDPDFDEPESAPDFFDVEPLLSVLDDESPLLLDELLEELSDPLLDDGSLDEPSDDDPDFSPELSPDFSPELSPEPVEAVVDDPLLLSVL